jgi:hypothetical protein
MVYLPEAPVDHVQSSNVRWDIINAQCQGLMATPYSNSSCDRYTKRHSQRSKWRNSY